MMRSLLLVAAFGATLVDAKGYADYDWEELPEGAEKAAEVLGYTQMIWDDDLPGPYEGKPFTELTSEEKRAAVFLDMSCFDSHFNDLWWDDLDYETNKYAALLGWTKDQWDGNGHFENLDNDWWWNDMTDEQKEAAEYFGYTQATWDEDPAADFEVDGDDRRVLLERQPERRQLL